MGVCFEPPFEIYLGTIGVFGNTRIYEVHSAPAGANWDRFKSLFVPGGSFNSNPAAGKGRRA